jgi:cytochrome c oxidase subunit I
MVQALGGWTQYAPLNADGRRSRSRAGLGRSSLDAASIGIFCIGQLLGSLNFITTTLDMRCKGMSLMRLPLSAWAWFITSVMGLTAFAVLMPACILLHPRSRSRHQFLRRLQASSINDSVLPHQGGSTLLWQHLFWFFGHPEVYIAIVPGMGIVSHVLITNMRRPMLSHRTLIYSMGSLAVLSYMVYGHHMFVSGMNPVSALAFSFPTLIITIPSTIVVLIWLGSLYGSKLRINAASLFALGFISMFISGGVSGFFLAQPSLDIMLHATYFVVGHFHLVMAVAAMFGIFAGTYFWFPKMTGRMMNDGLGKLHFILSFIGAYCIFMPFHYLGIAGNVRRYQAFTDDYLIPLIPVHKFITIAALLTGLAQVIFIYNLIYSRFKGEHASDNPWQGTSLEWSTATPPPHNNFGDTMPVVYHDPYQYNVEGAAADYIMQTSTEKAHSPDEEK